MALVVNILDGVTGEPTSITWPAGVPYPERGDELVIALDDTTTVRRIVTHSRFTLTKTGVMSFWSIVVEKAPQPRDYIKG